MTADQMEKMEHQAGFYIFDQSANKLETFDPSKVGQGVDTKIKEDEIKRISQCLKNIA